MTVQKTGADVQLVALYGDGSVRAGTIGELVEIAADYASYPETLDDGVPVKVYYRVDDRLEEANVFVEHGKERSPNGLCDVTMQVFRLVPGSGVVAAASSTF